MANQPYVIVAPGYYHGSAGVRVLHRLGHLLNLAGQTAYIYKNRTNPDWNISTISPESGDQLIASGAILVYPEIISGNPLEAPVVVRYILNNPGRLGGKRKFASSELLFSYTKQLLQPGMNQEQVLCLPVIDHSIFYDDGRPRDIEYLVYVGKYAKRLPHYPADKLIYRHKPETKVVAELLRRSKKLISYDNFTVMTFEATLCGCPVIIIPDGSRKKADLENGEYGLNGIAWGESAAEWTKALETLPNAPLVLKGLEDKINTEVKKFINLSQEHAKKILATSSARPRSNFISRYRHRHFIRTFN